MHYDYDEADVRRMVEQMAERIAAVCRRTAPTNVIGIRTRGNLAFIAVTRAACFARLPTDRPGRVLDITLYRDDLSDIGPWPVGPAHADRHRH